jgi:hypothetical protein
MENRRFDALTRSLAAGGSRRAVLKGLLGIGAAAVGGGALAGDVDAARRGFAGPRLPLGRPCTNGCPPNHTCIDGLCFDPCIGCACGACTLVPGRGSFCSNDVYATSGSCAGNCDAGYACDGANLCMKPCEL